MSVGHEDWGGIESVAAHAPRSAASYVRFLSIIVALCWDGLRFVNKSFNTLT
jgi:hypothetical protein